MIRLPLAMNQAKPVSMFFSKNSVVGLAALALMLWTLPDAGMAQSSDVLDIAGERVSLDDFQHVYGKNNRDSVYSVEALDDYMELFINFKLKVREAEAMGMDTAEAFITELAGYRSQLARPYLVDGDLLDAMVEEAYQRKGMEVRASHILVSVDDNATPADTLAAWNRIQGIRARVTSGEDFEAVARSKNEATIRPPPAMEGTWAGSPRFKWCTLSNAPPSTPPKARSAPWCGPDLATTF